MDAVYACDAMIWSSPTYHGSVSGSFKNALDWLILLAERDPPYLTNKPIGLVTTARGVQGLQAINSMEFIVRALRGWSVPLLRRWRSRGGRSTATAWFADDAVADQLRALGAEVVRAARQFRAEGHLRLRGYQSVHAGRQLAPMPTSPAALVSWGMTAHSGQARPGGRRRSGTPWSARRCGRGTSPASRSPGGEAVPATNNHLPHLYALRDDRQVFASGIWTLAVLSGTLLVAVREG